MQTQQLMDDADLKDLKEKLQNIKNMPKPEDKDKMIEYLKQRLNAEQAAITTIEGIIQHERDNRKEMSQDIKQRNKVLKTLIDKESNLNDRINVALETTLESAVRDKIKMRKDINSAKKKLQEKNSKLDILRKRNAELKQRSAMQDQQITECNQQATSLADKISENKILQSELEDKNLANRTTHEQAIAKKEEIGEVMSHLG